MLGEDAAGRAPTVEPVSGEAGGEGVGGVQVSRFDTVSLNVQDTDLAQVLQLLSIQGQRNIVPSPKVAGSVTANLYDVTFHEALDAILQQNGAGYIEKGNFIFVYTLDELKKIQDADRQVTNRVFRLDYITAQDASTFVTPLLSSAGSIAISGEVGAGFQPTAGDGGANSYAHEETMVVTDYPENIEEIEKIIENLDIRPSQVLVEATILQANLTEDLAFGVDLAILADVGVESATEGPLGAVGDMISGDIQETPSGAVTTGVGNTSGPGGIKAGVLTNNVAAFIRALDQVTDTTIMANPKIMALNRQRAEVLVGEKVAYLSTTATATATTQTVEFLDTGTQLTLRPFVSSDGMVRMELKPQISSAELREAGGGVTLPDETTQELTTNVMVRDGQTVVLGGLFKEETTISRNQVPFLGDIPVLGNAFKGRNDLVNRSEVIFLITPHILKDKDLARAGEAAMEGIEQLRIGAREGLLPWSRSKMTAAHVREALEYLEEEDRERALWEVDLALGLDPTMVEARRLKEKLTGQRDYWPSGNLLDDAVDAMIEEQAGERTPSGTRITPDRGPLGARDGADRPASEESAEPAASGRSETAEKRGGASVKPASDSQPHGASAEPNDSADRAEPAVQPASDTAPAKQADDGENPDWMAPEESADFSSPDGSSLSGYLMRMREAGKDVSESLDEAGDGAEESFSDPSGESADAPAAAEPEDEAEGDFEEEESSTARLLRDFGSDA